MKSQIIPINPEPKLDDSFIRIVNEHHNQVIAERRRQRAAALAEQQERTEHRYFIANQVLNGLLCAALGALAMLGYITLTF